MTQNQRPNEPVASIPLPSADLINFRFDQNDKNVAELKAENQKQFNHLSDKLDTMTNSFLTKEDAANMKLNSDAEHKALWAEIKSMKNTTRWWITTVLTIMGILAVLYVNRH